MKAVSSPLAVAVIALALFCPEAAAEQVLLRYQSWVVTAQDRFTCARPPIVTIEGPATIFEEANRGALQAVIVGITPVLKRQCSNLTEAILSNGRTKRVVTLTSDSSVTSPPSSPSPAVTGGAQGPPRAGSAVRLKPLMPYPDRRLQPLAQAAGIDAKCELLLAWLGRVQQEYPDAAGAKAVNAAQGLGLYRDRDFTQLFDVPFDQTTTRSRGEAYDRVISRCQGVGGMTTYASQFAPYRALLDGPFLGEAGPTSPQAVSAAVLQARTARGWMDTAIRDAGILPPTLTTFRDLESRLTESRTRLAALWPSERKHFAEQIEVRRTEIAGVVVDAWIAEIGTLGNTAADLQHLSDGHGQRREVISAADASRRSAVQAAYGSKLDAILAGVVPARTGELADVPATLAGARQLRDWQVAFDRDFKGHAERPAVVSAQPAIASQRTRILEGALPEWQALVAQPDATGEGLQKLSTMLGEFFPESAEKEPIYRSYQQALGVQLEKKNRAEYAVAAKQCDALGAHPDDPDAAAPGVPDGKLNAPGVIAACETAIKSTSAEPRMQFQLARGDIKAGRLEDAVEHLLFAANRDHGGALAYLGDLHLDGGLGIEPDPAVAFSLYERAVNAGFEPAKAMLQEFEDVTDRGVTGKTTADGRALITFQGRIFAVPSSRAGINPSASAAARRSKWTDAKKAAVSADIQALLAKKTRPRKVKQLDPIEL